MKTVIERAIKNLTPTERLAMAADFEQAIHRLAMSTITKAEKRYCRLEGIEVEDFASTKLRRVHRKAIW